MTQKLAYLWGPISSFSGPLAALLVNKGWHVHVATKASLNIFSLVPLDLKSTALELLGTALGGHEKLRTFQDRIKLVDESELNRATKYDAIIFCGLPPNFDEPRAPRAHWAAAQLPALLKNLQGTPIYLISSIWGGVQLDGVVPEEFEFTRRKPVTQWEGVCQHYEQKLLEGLEDSTSPWYLVRIPMISGSATNGETMNFTGPSGIFREVTLVAERKNGGGQKRVRLHYNPDSMLSFLPADIGSLMFWRYLEDENRPRICNIVNMQATLNQEWLQYVARAAGIQEIVAENADDLNLSGTLRKMLLDNIQVKTRNLFEVAGRYQLPPVRLDQEYFERVIRAGRQKRWGQPTPGERKVLGYSERLAQYYFEVFVPAHFDANLLKKVTTGGATIGFLLKGPDKLGWVLKDPGEGSHSCVERLDPSGQRPRICFRFTGSTMTQLIQSKLPLHRALLLREVEVEGSLWEALKVSNLIEQFLKDNPMDAEKFESEGNP